MISICVPIYNFNITELAQNLSQQSLSTNIPIEIIFVDDCSKTDFKIINKTIQLLPNTKYIELVHNIGRSAIRNHLAHLATYKHLIFIDCDSSVEDNFIRNYINAINGEALVICGGTTYSPLITNKAHRLHWTVGKNREVISAQERNTFPNSIFFSNNFLIEKRLFLETKFDERLTQYGHEDTLFGIELLHKGIRIKHIDNPAQHIGLEPNHIFLQKTEQALENLLFITTNPIYQDELENHIRILAWYSHLKNLKLCKPLGITFKLLKKIIQRNLNSNNPSLILFDLYKLGYLCSLS